VLLRDLRVYARDYTVVGGGGAGRFVATTGRHGVPVKLPSLRLRARELRGAAPPSATGSRARVGSRQEQRAGARTSTSGSSSSSSNSSSSTSDDDDDDDDDGGDGGGGANAAACRCHRCGAKVARPSVAALEAHEAICEATSAAKARGLYQHSAPLAVARRC